MMKNNHFLIIHTISVMFFLSRYCFPSISFLLGPPTFFPLLMPPAPLLPIPFIPSNVIPSNFLPMILLGVNGMVLDFYNIFSGKSSGIFVFIYQHERV